MLDNNYKHNQETFSLHDLESIDQLSDRKEIAIVLQAFMQFNPDLMDRAETNAINIQDEFGIEGEILASAFDAGFLDSCEIDNEDTIFLTPLGQAEKDLILKRVKYGRMEYEQYSDKDLQELNTRLSVLRSKH